MVAGALHKGFTVVTEASAIFATATTGGTIKPIDAKSPSIMLVDGAACLLPTGFNLAAFRVAEKVAVTWDLNGKVNKASAVMVLG